MSITVIIPSRRRPQYLKTALESVKRQKAFHAIKKIIVSENSEDDGSRSVCESFPELPIRYYKQVPELTGIDHITWIINQSDSEYTAMLHDDDWWYPTHLESALEALQSTGASGYFSNFVFTENEIYKNAFFHYASVFSYFTEERGAFSFPAFDLKAVASICYLFTPFHMSAMVARTKPLQEATMQSVALAKPFYADRILYPFLALYGKLVLNPQLLCGIRMHAQNDSNNIHQQEKINDHAEGSAKIRRLAVENNIDILSTWNDIKQSVPLNEWALFQNIHNFYLGECTETNSPFFVPAAAEPAYKPPFIGRRILNRMFKTGN